MSRWLALCSLLSACNLIYSIDETRFVDDDQPPENPVCPAAGTAPVFRPNVSEILARNCFGYATSESAGRAVALCLDGGMVRVEEGEIDGPLAPAQIVTTPSAVSISKVWLAPEGDLLVVHQHSGQPPTHQIALYARQGNTWTWTADVVSTTDFISSGVPSAAPERHLFVSTITGYRELAQQGGTWTEVHSGTWTSLGATNGTGDSSNLSADGLQLTFTVGYTPMYTYRASMDLPFPPAVRIDTLGQARDVFMGPNCGKAYFSGLSSVFYRYQL